MVKTLSKAARRHAQTRDRLSLYSVHVHKRKMRRGRGVRICLCVHVCVLILSSFFLLTVGGVRLHDVLCQPSPTTSTPTSQAPPPSFGAMSPAAPRSSGTDFASRFLAPPAPAPAPATSNVSAARRSTSASRSPSRSGVSSGARASGGGGGAERGTSQSRLRVHFEEPTVGAIGLAASLPAQMTLGGHLPRPASASAWGGVRAPSATPARTAAHNTASTLSASAVLPSRTAAMPAYFNTPTAASHEQTPLGIAAAASGTRARSGSGSGSAGRTGTPADEAASPLRLATPFVRRADGVEVSIFRRGQRPENECSKFIQALRALFGQLLGC